MATQTGSYDFKSTKAAKETAEKVATNFVATDSLGMMVYDGTSGTHTPTNPGANTSNVLIDSNSVDIRQGTDVLATFGSPTRIGKRNAENVTIDSSGVSINTPNLQSAVNLSSFPTDNTYAGTIDLGGGNVGQYPPHILGVTDDTAEANQIEVGATANGSTYLASARLITQDEESNYAEIIAETSNRYPSVGLSATDSNGGGSFIHIDIDGMVLDAPNVSFQSDTVNMDGTLTIQDHSSPIGAYLNEETSASVSVPSATSTPLMSITLDAGAWIIRAYVRFPSMGTDRTKYVQANISSQSGATGYHLRGPAENMIVQSEIVTMVKPTSTTTYYLNAYHNTGSSKTFPTGQAMRAIRIA